MDPIQMFAVCGSMPLLADEGGGFNPLDVGDWSLFLWTVVVFLVLFFILTKFAWRPILGMVSAREERIREDLANAEEARKEAEETREKHRREMEQASQQAKALLDETRERASTLQAELETKARDEAEAIVAKARTQIESEKVAAMQQIRDQVVDLSVEINRRLAAEGQSRDDHARLADELIPKLKSLN